MAILCVLTVAVGGALGGQIGTQGAHATVDGDTPADASMPSAGLSSAAGAITIDDHEEAENETKRHENPDEYGEDGDLDGLEGWLAGRLGGQLGDSAIQLSEGEYELARQFVGDEYRDRFGQYVDVAGQTDGESHEETFEDARTEQERLVNQTEEYEETREAYEEAHREGDTERARELARELDELADEINATGTTLRGHYEVLDNQTDADLSEADQAIATLVEEIQVEQADILAAEFVETELVVDAERTTISFLDPLVATGQLRTVDGDPIADETVRLSIAGDDQLVETDADGGFEFTYRPTDLPLSTSSVTVEYLEDTRSVYLGSTASVSVTVEQVEPSLAVDATPGEIAYGDAVPASGELIVEGVPVDGVTLDVILDGQTIGTVGVSDGSFDGAGDVPATIPDGEHSLAVRLPYEDRALAGVVETRSVTVSETDTTLSVNASQAGDGTVRVTGDLETVDGLGVGGEPVDVSIDGTTVATVTTDGDGRFAETVSVPDAVEYGERDVAAAYRGAGSNLGPAEAETVVDLEPMDGSGDGAADGDSEATGGAGDDGDSEATGGAGDDGFIPSDPVDSLVGDDGLSTWAWVGAAVGLLVIFAIVWWIRRVRGGGFPLGALGLPSIGLVERIVGSPDDESQNLDADRTSGEAESGPFGDRIPA